MSVHKKIQSNRSSRLAGYTQNIYANVLFIDLIRNEKKNFHWKTLKHTYECTHILREDIKSAKFGNKFIFYFLFNFCVNYAENTPIQIKLV